MKNDYETNENKERIEERAGPLEMEEFEYLSDGTLLVTGYDEDGNYVKEFYEHEFTVRKTFEE